MGFLFNRRKRFVITVADLPNFVARTGLIPIVSHTSWLQRVRDRRLRVRF